MDQYNYEFAWDSKYCYPHSLTLKNKLNIQDSNALKIAEREITAVRVAYVRDNPISGNLDLKHLCAIHKYIFQDIYSWAGKLRTVNISKGNQFCLCQHLETYAQGIFGKKPIEDFLAKVNAENIAEWLTYYLSEINVLHPFREGNGRTQRVFIEYLAGVAGFHVDFSDVSDKVMIEASALSFDKDYTMMETMFRDIITPIDYQERQEFHRKLGLDKHQSTRSPSGK